MLFCREKPNGNAVTKFFLGVEEIQPIIRSPIESALKVSF
jgi:hypothetical protein